jgi:hypothetical protein
VYGGVLPGNVSGKSVTMARSPDHEHGVTGEERAAPGGLAAPAARSTAVKRLDEPTERLFRALSSRRGRRIFHPSGIAYAGSLTPLRDADVFSRGGERRVLLRFSRGLGLPGPLADFLGLAVRIEGDGPGNEQQDLLLASSLPGRVGKFVLWPAETFFETTFTTVLPYESPRGRVLVGARVEGPSRRRGYALRELDERVRAGGVRFTLAVARVGEAWREDASVTVLERLPQSAAERLRFHPWRSAGDLRPAGLVNALRGPAYAGSQRGRAARGGEE